MGQQYLAKSTNSLIFDVTIKNKSIAKLKYKSWFKFNAEVEFLQSKYKIEPKGFWGTTIELKNSEGTILLKFKMNWNGEIVIHSFFDETQKDFIFKRKGFIKEVFTLSDKEENELLVMKPNLKWSQMNYEYQIETSDNFETFSNKEMLLSSTVHCANYYMSMMMAATIT